MKNIIKPSVALALLFCSLFTAAQTQQITERAYPEGYITGVVTSAAGPEAGVWVIAETKETNTPFVKIVVTDDEGRPSNFWGMDHIWGVENPSDPHNPMMDSLGRVWMTSKIRNDQPVWCGEGSDNKFAQYFPLTRSGRQASVYDPETQQFELIDTCFATHHLQFANNPERTLYFNELSGPMFGWVDTRTWDLTHDEQASQGWCPQIIDTNGDGVITKPWNSSGGENPNPDLDTEVSFRLYSVIPDPRDGDVVWGASESYPGHIVRLDRGDSSPETCISEVYHVAEGGLDPRGIDIDSNGVVWAAMAASSHFARFDRTQCDVLNGPGTDAGTHCEQGWTLFKTDGPTYPGTDIPSDFHYFGWVDQHNISGLGKDTPIITGSNSKSDPLAY